MTLFGKKDLYRCNQVNMRSLGWALNQHDWFPYKKGKFGQRDDTHTGRTPCEREGRDQGAASTSQARVRLPAHHQKPGERPGQVLPHSLRWNQLLTPESQTLISRTVRQYIPIA